MRLLFALSLVAYVIACLAVTSVLADYGQPDVGRLREVIGQLQQRVSALQWRESASFRPFPLLRWATQKGLYKSSIHFNVKNTLVRRHLSMPDSNMFVTNFVVMALLEAESLGTIVNDKDELRAALEAVLSYRDKNHPRQAPVFNFWPQREASNGTWTASPTNLIESVRHFEGTEKWILAVLKAAHLEHLFEEVKQMFNRIEQMATAFAIPADTDDTSCNLALAATIESMRGAHEDLAKILQQQGYDYSILADTLTKYAYRPFAKEVDTWDSSNLIDPRSYYLLSDVVGGSDPASNLSLPVTWLLDLNADRRLFPLVSMPFHVNNVDLSVASNFLFGVSQHVLLGGDKGRLLSSPAMVNLYRHTARLLAWGIESEAVLKRPDIAILYYPSLYDLYYLVARNVHLLNDNAGRLPHPALEEARAVLTRAFRTAGTQQLLRLAIRHDELRGWLYWDDFLGDRVNKTLHGDDRSFSTAMAINALLDAWTTRSQSCKRQWLPDAPAEVKRTVLMAVSYLERKILAASAMNAFFSGSVKSVSSLPYWYPGTFYYYLNGTRLDKPDDSDAIDEKLIVAFRGRTSNADYAQLLQRRWFGVDTPRTFDGFNEDSFPFWSSDAMTYAYTLLSFSKYTVVAECKQPGASVGLRGTLGLGGRGTLPRST